MFKNMGCVIMASGLGKRFGSNKLMADFGGKPMIQWILDTTEGLFDSRVVVTRHKEIEQICRKQGIKVILHDFPGRNDTVRLGLETFIAERQKVFSEFETEISSSKNQKLKNADTRNGDSRFLLKHCIFCQSDQPLLSRETIISLAELACEKEDKICRVKSGERIGTPVIFPSWAFGELLKLPEGKGGGVVIKKYPEQVRTLEVQNTFELRDVDTREDLQELASIYERK